MKRSLALSLLVITVVSVVSAATTTTAGGLETPTLVRPHGNYNYGGQIGKSYTFQWKAVSGATRYTASFQKAIRTPELKLIGWGPYAPGDITYGTQQAPVSGVVHQSFVFHKPGTYRWRVTAWTPQGETHSNYCIFTIR